MFCHKVNLLYHVPGDEDGYYDWVIWRVLECFFWDDYHSQMEHCHIVLIFDTQRENLMQCVFLYSCCEYVCNNRAMFAGLLSH